MKRTIGYLLIILFPFLVQCGDYGLSGTSFRYGNMDCSSAVLTTDVFTFDSLKIAEIFRVDEIDDFGMAVFYFNSIVQNGCPGDSVTCEITCHLLQGSPKDIIVSQEVKMSLDPTDGYASFHSIELGNVYEITSHGSYLAPKRSTDTEFVATISLSFESTGNDATDVEFIKQYFKDLTVRFTYLKLPL